MGFDLSTLTPRHDLRAIPPLRAMIVCAVRYVHVARIGQCYCHEGLQRFLGSGTAIRPFHCFLSEVDQYWPEPVALNRPCDPMLSFDEMLLTDMLSAAATGDRDGFDRLIHDMIPAAGRHAMWFTGSRLVRAMNPPA
ncbi:hypothetical protein [Croceicoccus hydrothermalis]|uniref:hypothetical protein n=1 Tax=Croceicoccus hydrothermalis TaxID=2867964 RepID=UPI001EFBC649|nr:hypothetical protein [Croceicoccus hydrothermalis]